MYHCVDGGDMLCPGLGESLAIMYMCYSLPALHFTGSLTRAQPCMHQLIDSDLTLVGWLIVTQAWCMTMLTTQDSSHMHAGLHNQGPAVSTRAAG